MSSPDEVHKVPEPPVATRFSLVSPRGARLATRVWSPPKRPIAILLIVHGGVCHSGKHTIQIKNCDTRRSKLYSILLSYCLPFSGYFDGLGRRLNEENIFVAAYDQISQGYSDPEPGAPAGYLHIHEFDDFIEDIWAAVDWAYKEAQDENHKMPLFLLGESFGGLQVLAAGLDASNQNDQQASSNVPNVAGVITLGALLEVNPAVLPPRFIIRILTCLSPYYPKMRMPATDFGDTFEEAFGDKNWASTARQDPVVQVSPKGTLGAITATVATGEKVLERAREFHLPLLAIHARADCRTECSAVEQFVDQAGSDATGFFLEETSGHQLLQGVPAVTAKVMDKIAGWIQLQVERKSHN